MRTRGFVGLVIDGNEKIILNYKDSHPRSLGVDVLADVQDLVSRLSVDALRRSAADLRSCEDLDVVEFMRAHPALVAQARNAGIDVVDDADLAWGEMLRFSSLSDTLEIGAFMPNAEFPLHSGSCEWGYLIDLDADNGPDRPAGRFEVYIGRQKSLPTEGRWAGRPTRSETERWHKQHLVWCEEDGRDPWLPRFPQYKAVQLLAAWPLDELPSKDHFLAGLDA